MIEVNLLETLSDALGQSSADQTEIVAESVHTAVTRYAGSQIHQTTVLDDVRLWVRAVVGKSLGAAGGHRLADLPALIEQAGAVARTQPANPEFASLPEPEALPEVAGFDPITAELSAAARAEAIRTITHLAGERSWTAAGTYLTEARELHVVNSLGIQSHARSTLAYLRALVDSGAGTGYADALSWRAGDLDAGNVAQHAIAKCDLNHDQIEVPPGEYEAIFEDLAVAEALLHLSRPGFSGQSYQEGTSFMAGRMDEPVTGEQVTIWDDATDSIGLPVAADYEGVSKRRLPVIERGIARGVAYDSYYAHRAGLHSTGHATSPEYTYGGPMTTNLFMAGGPVTIEDMIRSTSRGLLLTRFHYTHLPDPRHAVMTGTTRDGTFLIERGEIVGAVKNLRLTQAVPDLFAGIELLGPPRLCRDWWCSNGMGRMSYVCPPIKVSRAVFDSGTLF